MRSFNTVITYLHLLGPILTARLVIFQGELLAYLILIAGTSVVVKPNYYDPYFVQTQFNAVINENATIGTTVMSLVAGDNDTGMAGLVHYNSLQGNGSNYFMVNDLTGVITTLLQLNSRTTPKVFFFTANVRDHGTPLRYSARSVNITIAVLSPSSLNNSITTVNSLTMDVILSKEPFLDEKIIRYQVVAQEYDPNTQNCEHFHFNLCSFPSSGFLQFS